MTAMRPMTSPSTIRLLRAMRFAILAAVALLVGHDAVYVTSYGAAADFASAMRDGGHDAYWTVYSLAVAAGAMLILARAGIPLVRLSRGLEDDAEAAGGAPPAVVEAVVPYRRELRSLATRLLPTVLVGFLLQENLEHVLGHGHIVGLAPLLGQEQPFALPVIAAVVVLVAAIGALVRWRIRTLSARLAARVRSVRHPRPAARPVPSSWWLTGAACAHRWILLRGDAGRAPPRSRALTTLA